MREFRVLSDRVTQLTLAVDALVERLDRTDDRDRRLGPPPPAPLGPEFRLSLEPAPGEVPPSHTWGDVASTPLTRMGQELAAPLARVEQEIADAKTRVMREADRAIAAEELKPVRELERPFKASPYDKDGIVTAGGRRVCAVYNADERAAIIALLNMG